MFRDQDAVVTETTYSFRHELKHKYDYIQRVSAFIKQNLTKKKIFAKLPVFSNTNITLCLHKYIPT